MSNTTYPTPYPRKTVFFVLYRRNTRLLIRDEWGIEEEIVKYLGICFVCLRYYFVRISTCFVCLACCFVRIVSCFVRLQLFLADSYSFCVLKLLFCADRLLFRADILVKQKDEEHYPSPNPIFANHSCSSSVH